MVRQAPKKKIIRAILPPQKKVAVLGSGSWATALVKMLTDNNVKVYWYIRKEEDKAFIEEKRHNPSYLSSVQFKKRKLTLYNSIDETIKAAEILIFAIPSAFLSS